MIWNTNNQLYLSFYNFQKTKIWRWTWLRIYTDTTKYQFSIYRCGPSATEIYKIFELALGFSKGKLQQTTGALKTQDPV